MQQHPSPFSRACAPNLQLSLALAKLQVGWVPDLAHRSSASSIRCIGSPQWISANVYIPCLTFTLPFPSLKVVKVAYGSPWPWMRFYCSKIWKVVYLCINIYIYKYTYTKNMYMYMQYLGLRWANQSKLKFKPRFSLWGSIYIYMP